MEELRTRMLNLAVIASLLFSICKADSEVGNYGVSEASSYQNYLPNGANMRPQQQLLQQQLLQQQLQQQQLQQQQLQQQQHQNHFGGDRSDRFLYPPRSYYARWAADEERKDNNQNNQWQNWQGRPMQSNYNN
ncbi:putative uncharacterized protein DDB_G0271606 [Macrosteles quadrilineatus]|uniref:putative uncharacterized protein DDB_G0271606 n=1 Tax=Macrosteles quadrilineatus TaxID=74068 RepID=UPI0023E0A1BC|nr:putative uncharacterized protein DDB_G0271606 [Macrosteles quadrilineatus]